MPTNPTNVYLSKEKASVFQKASQYGRLIFRLILDPRVSLFLKVLPVGSLLYLLLPDLIPFVLDDTLVMGLGVYLFLALCPQDVVQEHRDEILAGERGAVNVVDVEVREPAEE